MRRLVVATRGSALARTQTALVCDALEKAHGIVAQVRVIETRGDVDQSDRLAGRLEKGFFTAELEQALREGVADFAVHSLKDVPTQTPADLGESTVFERAPPADLLIARVPELGPGDRIGTSALRREALVERYFPQAKSVPLRGNVPTRVAKLLRGDYEAIILAEAGVRRLGLDLSALKVFRLDPTRWIPAPAQGVLAVQWLARREELVAPLSALRDPETQAAATLERMCLAVSEGGCSAPFGCFVQGDRARVGLDTVHGWRRASIARADTSPDRVRGVLERLRSDPDAGSNEEEERDIRLDYP